MLVVAAVGGKAAMPGVVIRSSRPSCDSSCGLRNLMLHFQVRTLREVHCLSKVT